MIAPRRRIISATSRRPGFFRETSIFCRTNAEVLRLLRKYRFDLFDIEGLKPNVVAAPIRFAGAPLAAGLGLYDPAGLCPCRRPQTQRPTPRVAAGRPLVCVPDRITDILIKGIQPNYYKSGELFDEVHILMIHDDRPDRGKLQRTVGRARLLFATGLTIDAAAARPWLARFRLREWAKGGVDIARKIKPQLIAAMARDLNTYLASKSD